MTNLSVKKLHDDLDYWIHIGIGDDIVKLPAQRIEYQALVKDRRFLNEPSEVARLVLKDLALELRQPWFLRPTFWRLLWLKITRQIK